MRCSRGHKISLCPQMLTMPRASDVVPGQQDVHSGGTWMQHNPSHDTQFRTNFPKARFSKDLGCDASLLSKQGARKELGTGVWCTRRTGPAFDAVSQGAFTPCNPQVYPASARLMALLGILETRAHTVSRLRRDLRALCDDRPSPQAWLMAARTEAQLAGSAHRVQVGPLAYSISQVR